jgi:hypothetical protein
MSIFDDLLKYASQENGDVFHSRKQMPNGDWEETMMVGLPVDIPEFRSNLTQEARKEEKQVKTRLTELLPPRDQFIYDLRLLLDLAKATEKERSVMNKLIDRFNGKK